MLPINKKDTMPCTPISSNCVIWQGPDIECINLCNGDTVSDVVAKLATELCALINATCECNPDLTDLDLNCIPSANVPDPTNLVDVLNGIIIQVCESTTGSTTALNTTSKRVAADGNLLLPKCLYYNDEFGNPVTELPINEFVVYLANEICNIQSSIVLINSAIQNFETRIGILENCVLPCKPQKDVITEVVSKCIFPGDLVQVSTLLLAIEQDYCTFKTSIGTSQDVFNSLSAQAIVGTTERLSGGGTYGSLTKWINSPANLSQSHNDQWIVLNDLYTAIKDIKDNFIDVGCKGINFGFTYNVVIDGAGIPTNLNLNFTSTSLPASYSDCDGSTNVKITDSNGNEINQSVNIASLQNNPTGATIGLTTLNVNNSITVQVDFCATDGVNQCAEKQSIVIPLETVCPNDIAASGITEDSVIVTFTNVLGTAVTYKIDIVDDTTDAIAATTTINNPAFSITKTFGSLASGTDYKIVTTVTSNGVPKICTAVLFTTAGINCENFSTNTTGASGSNDIYLGHTESGGVQTDYYYNPDNKVIVVGTPAVPTCYAPIFSNYSINELTGDVTYDVAYGLAPGTNITIEYSIDGVTFLSPSIVAPGAGLIYATGVTSGTVYLRLQTDCTTSVSKYVIIRYDFITEQWQFIQSPSDCQYDSIVDACPAGVQVAQQYLQCGTVTYTVFSGGIDSYWFYIRKYVREGVTFYVYAGWNQLSGVTTVVECCTCPAFILTDLIRIFCQEGNSVNINIPYVLGSGLPTMTTISPTTNGSLVQSTTGSNSYTYTHIAASNSYADTFQVEIEPQTIGDCESLTATIQIQIIPSRVKLNYQDQAIFAFVDSNTYSVADATDIKSGLTALAAQWNSDWGYTGTVYFIPVNDKRWLGYQKAIVDDGVSANLAGGLYTALEVLPTSWTGGAPIYKNGVMLLAFSNDSDGLYHDATLVSGFGSGLTAQPRTEYQEDFDALYDAVNGTNTSAWATGLGIVNPQYPDGLSAVYYPFTVQFSGSADAASILQSTAAYVGEMIPPNEYGIQTAVDITGYLLQGLVPSATNPYQGAPTTGGNTLIPLYTYGFLMYVDNLLKTGTLSNIAAGVDLQFINQLTLAVQDASGSFPATPTGTILFEVIRCNSGTTGLIEYTGGAPYPAVNTTYEVLAADNSTPDDQYFHIIGYGLGVALFDFTNPNLIAGCEISSTQFRVADCTTGYEYDVEFGVTAGVIPGNVYKLTNTGPDFLPGAPDDWLTGQDRCVTVLSQLVIGLDISSITVVSTHLDCTTCTP
jgi:hypothetical protein